MLSIHAVAATKIPEMALEPSEAQALAERVLAVEKYYPKISAIISGRVADHVALAGVLIQVYGTRVLAIKMRLDKERAGGAGEANVIDLTGRNLNGGNRPLPQ